eukprot:366117-Chlamydomonas_euryale.AAC.9
MCGAGAHALRGGSVQAGAAPRPGGSCLVPNRRTSAQADTQVAGTGSRNWAAAQLGGATLRMR